MEFLLLLAIMAMLAMPVVALIVALVVSGRQSRADKVLREREKEAETLRTRLMKMEQRLAALEGRGVTAPAEPRVAPGQEVQPVLPPVPPAPHAPPPAPPAPSVPSAAPKPPAIAATPAPAASASVPPAPRLEPAVTIRPAAPAAARPTAPTAARPTAPAAPRPEGPGLEERLGARLPVWIGSVALTLAGAYLVKYSFDRGLISETMRVALGILFAFVLLGGGEWLRRRSTYVAAGLSASGVGVLYACFLAATNLYHLMPPVAGFALMAATTGLAVALSLRQGALIAVLGLVGGFLTPVLIQTGEVRPGPLFAYLFLLEVGILAVTRQRRWWPLAGLTLLAAMGWVGAWLGFAFKPEHAIYLGAFIVASAAAFAAVGLLARGEDRRPEGAASLLIQGALGLALAMAAGLAGVAHYGTLEWCFLGLLGIGCLVLGRRDAQFEGLAWVAGLGTAGMMAVWAVNLHPADLTAFLLTALGLGLLHGLGAYACLWGSARPDRWASLSASSALAFLLVAYWGERATVHEMHWGLPALGLAALYAALATPVFQRRRELPAGEAALAALAVAATAFVSLAVALQFEEEWIAVGWAMEVAALGWISGALRVKSLRTLAWPVAGLVLVRLLFNPEVVSYPTGDLPVFNWILYGYGVPALAFALAAWLMARQGDELLSSALQWGAVALGLVLALLQVRQSFHPGHLNAPNLGLLESGCMAVAAMVYGLALLGASGRWPLASLAWGGKLSVGLGLAACGLFPVLALDPLWTKETVGALPVLNHLLWLYGAPALLALAAAWLLQGRGEVTLPRLLGVVAIGLAFVLVTLEVRQAFQGELLDGGSMASSEKYAYSITWVLFGTVLLVLGIVTRGAVLRYASLAVMLLAVGKVFLYDTAQLRGLYRIFSLVGLGASLMLLAFLYKRFVLGGSVPQRGGNTGTPAGTSGDT